MVGDGDGDGDGDGVICGSAPLSHSQGVSVNVGATLVRVPYIAGIRG